MERGEIFEFINDNGTTIKAVCLSQSTRTGDTIEDGDYNSYVCYAQNKLFYIIQTFHVEWMSDSPVPNVTEEWEEGNTLVNYCLIPEFDEILKNYE